MTVMRALFTVSALMFVTFLWSSPEVQAAQCAQSRIGWWRCSPCGEGTRCVFCNWCVGLCIKPKEWTNTTQAKDREIANDNSTATGTYNDGMIEVPYKNSFLEMFKDIENGILNDDITELDVVELYRITSLVLEEDCGVCDHSPEIEELRNFTMHVHGILESLIGSDQFQSVALEETNRTRTKIEELPETLKAQVHSSSPILADLPDHTLGIMLTGGGGGPKGSQQKKKSVEILNMDGSHNCSLPNLLHETWGHTQNGLTVCGNSEHEFKSCFTFTNGNWKLSQNLLRPRLYHTSWQTGQGLLMMGGAGQKQERGTEMLSDPLVQPNYSFALEYASRRHCAIEFEDEVIFTGSEDNPKFVSVYTIQGFKEHLPDLLTGRYLHSCSYYTNSDDKQVLIVAGGGTSSKTFLDSTEMLVRGDAAWTEIASLKLTTPLRGPFMIHVRNSVLLTGGDLGETNVDTIWKLNVNNITWDEVGKMNKPRAYHKGSVIGMTEDIMKHCV